MQNTQKSKRYESGKCYQKYINTKDIGKEIAYIDNKPMVLVGVYNDITLKGFGKTKHSSDIHKNYKWICNGYSYYFYYESQGGK